MSEISIIIPNYNTEKYLKRCLDSLIGQTFNDIEIIVIDDGSKDKSVDIIKKYVQQDSRVKLIQQQNSGPAKARNQGLENATGKYLMFCDSDDWYEPNMCQEMYDTIEKQKVDVVCCHNFFDWEENLDNQEKEERLVEKYYNPKKSGKYVLSDKIILSTNVLLWNKIWRRDLVEEFHIRFPQGHEHDDDAFWYMYAMISKKIFYLPKPFYHYFLRSGSIMSTQANKQPKNRMDRVIISEYVLNFLIKNNLKKTKAHLMAGIFKNQLRCVCPFFNFDELKELCQNTNKTIKKELGISETVVCFETDKKRFILKDKSLIVLIYEWIWYRLCIWFWHFSKTPKGKQQYSFYMHRINRNNAYLKQRKENKNDA
ncbi:MAG: glycosyltransferase family 2 protein [Alphaproteobacteria bacterium]|nr:glycosyltransferase family 2 protein [Alphaproteobacteria bacterium]